MIEESLLKSNYLGKDGFIWWLGQVAPPEVWDVSDKVDIDPNKYSKSWAYRCKVRIVGYHTYDRNELSDNDLPWAHIMLGTSDGNSQGGLGKTHKIIGGETVFGFFLDGDDAQQPVIVGTLYRNHNVENFDIDEIAFKPFSGHAQNTPKSRVNKGSTKQSPVSSNQQEPSESSTGVENIIGGRMKSPLPANFNTNNKEDLFFPFDKALSIAYEKASRPVISSENGCDNNVIGKITKAIQNFIAVVSGLESHLNFYVDPVLNTFVDITQEIRRTATIITGSIKSLVNNMRNMIMKMVGCLFSKFVGLIIPIPQQPIVGEATKNILNIIFCLFERIIDLLLPFLEDMLKGLVGRAINAPLCAVEEFVATIINKMLNTIDDLLGPVMSGLNWLMNGTSQIKNILSRATSIATQIFNLIGCDNLKCETPSEWSLITGPNKIKYDNWDRTLKKMNTIGGFNNNLSTSVNSLSLYGSGSPIFRDCANRVKNPRSQDDLVNGGSKYPICLPPEVVVYGDGTGAQLVPVVGRNGSILSIEVLNAGFGYSKPPIVTIVDRSNCGSGARAGAAIQNGRISQAYVTARGSGYAPTNLNSIIRTPFYLVTADRYTLFEGETCTFTISTRNVTDGTILRYAISGDVNQNDIENPITDSFVIFNGSAKVRIKIRQDNVRETLEQLIFDVIDSNQDTVARAIVLINDRLAPILQVPGRNVTQSPPGTTIPVGTSTIGIGTTSPEFPSEDGVGTPGTLPDIEVIFDEVEVTIPDVTSGVGTVNVGVVTSIFIANPGIGYSSGDSIGIGSTILNPIVSPIGSIVDVNRIVDSPEFDILPDISIDTSVGEGAVIYPIIKFTPKQSVARVIVNQVGVLKVVDCI
jgi:hypothetical protein